MLQLRCLINIDLILDNEIAPHCVLQRAKYSCISKVPIPDPSQDTFIFFFIKEQITTSCQITPQSINLQNASFPPHKNRQLCSRQHARFTFHNLAISTNSLCHSQHRAVTLTLLSPPKSVYPQTRNKERHIQKQTATHDTMSTQTLLATHTSPSHTTYSTATTTSFKLEPAIPYPHIPSDNLHTPQHKMSQPAQPSQHQPPASTTKPPPSPISPSAIPYGNLTLKGIDVTNTVYPTSNLRTPVTQLPFPHPKFHILPYTGQIYEVTSPIHEEYDPVTGYVDGIHVGRGAGRRSRDDGMGAGEEKVWTGRVEWPESSVRSSIAREARERGKREREEKGEGSAGAGEEGGLRRSKRVRAKRS